MYFRRNVISLLESSGLVRVREQSRVKWSEKSSSAIGSDSII